MNNIVKQLNMDTPLFKIGGKAVTSNIMEIEIYDAIPGVIHTISRDVERKDIILVDVQFHMEGVTRLEFDKNLYNPKPRANEVFISQKDVINSVRKLNEKSKNQLVEALDIINQVTEQWNNTTKLVEDDDDNSSEIIIERKKRGPVVASNVIIENDKVTETTLEEND